MATRRRRARGPQVARKASAALVAGCRRLALLLVPPAAREVKCGVSVFRVSATTGVFEARAFVSWIPARGTRARAFGESGRDVGPDAALARLMAKLEKAPLLR